MAKRILSLLLAMVLCLGLCPVQTFAATEPAPAAEETVTRVQWVQALVAACSMTVEEDACPDNYFSDISSEDDFYRDVIVAVEFGLIDTEVGLAFRPHEPATREFVAHTLNAALMFQLPEGTEYTYAEAATVTYPEDIQVAVNRGWFALKGKSFLPEQAVTVTEKTAILESVATILKASQLEEDHVDRYTFAEGVKTIEDAEDVYLLGDDRVVITGSAVKLSVGDVFVVWIMDYPNAFEAVQVAADGDTVTVTAREVPIENVILSMDIQGEGDVDLAYFEPAEGFEPIYEFEDGSETTSTTYARATTKKVKAVHLPIKIPFDNVTVTGKLSLTNMTRSHAVEIWTEQYAMFRLDGDLLFTSTVEADLLGLAGASKSIMIGGINYGIGEAGVYAVFKVDGSFTLTVGGEFTVGLEASEVYGLRNLSRFKRTEFSMVTELNLKAGIQLKAAMNSMGVSAHAYFEMGAKAKVRNIRSEGRNCLDIVAYPYAEVDSSFSVDYVVWKDSISKHYDILKEGDTPKIHEHYEHGLHTLECSYGDFDCNGWRGGWNKFNLGGLIHGSSAAATYTLYDYELNEVNEATITKYYGNVSTLFVPKTLDGYDVVAIGNHAFEKNGYLCNVTIPDSIESIGEGAFRDCTRLHTVKLSAVLKTIPERAFANTALTTVDIPDTVTSLGHYAFADCKKLLDVQLSENLETLGEGVFSGCISLETITIPKSVTGSTGDGFYAQRGVFYNCPKLKEVILEEGITLVPAYLFLGNSSLETVIIPNTVTTIQAEAFRHAKALTQIVIPDSVTTLEKEAFAECPNLETVILSKNLTQLADSSFSGCSSLNNVVLPDAMTHLNDRAFADCTSLKEITLSKNLETFGESVFSGCASLETITIPKSVTGSTGGGFYASRGVFHNCPKLKEVILEEGITVVPAHLFLGNSSLETVTIPNTVTTIQTEAFRHAQALTQIVIPDSVTTLEKEAFAECPNLETVSLSKNLTQLADSAFSGCSSLNNVVLPDAMTHLNHRAFADCTSLTEVTLSKGLETLGDAVFSGCASLETITIPKSVTGSTGDGFYASQGVFHNCPKLKEVILEEGITVVPAHLLLGNSSVETITIPSTVTTIQTEAFRYAEALTQIVIPDSVTVIESEAFLEAINLVSVTLSQNLTKLEDQTFSGCTSLDNVVLPDSITRLGAYVFRTCSDMTNITLSKNLTYIDRLAFEDCTSLESIVIPEGVTFLGERCFKNCTALTSVTLPGSVAEIPSDAFYNCDGLTDIHIPQGVTTVKESAFYDCDALHTVTMANSVTKLERSVFEECGALKNVTLSQCLTAIPEKAFKLCAELETIVIPHNVTSIGREAFHSSPKLAKVVTYAPLNNIPSSAFSYKSTTVFSGVEGSDTQTWCASNGYQFQVNDVAVTGVTLEEANATIAKGKTYTLIPNVAPAGAGYTISYKSSKDTVATVDATGKITAVGVGTATIKVTAGGKSASFKITVTQEVTRIWLNTARLDLQVPATYQLTASVRPEDASNQTLTWTSSNEAAATVDENGLVTAVGNGTAVITATTNDGSNLSTSCTVTVTDPNNIPVNRITLNQTQAELEALDPLQLTATVAPNNAANKALVWSSSDEAIAKVDENGKVTAVAKGTAVITATAADGSGVSASCNVTVINNGYVVTDPNAFEGSHNYEDSCSDFWLYTDSGAKSLKITFDAQTYLEEDFDFLLVYDGKGTLIGEYTGDQLSSVTLEIPGDTVKIRMNSDDSGNEWGFKITKIEKVSGAQILVGDINGDGRINIADVSRLYAYCKGTSTPSEDYLIRYDVNGDGKVNIADVSRLYGHTRGIRPL